RWTVRELNSLSHTLTYSLISRSALSAVAFKMLGAYMGAMTGLQLAILYGHSTMAKGHLVFFISFSFSSSVSFKPTLHHLISSASLFPHPCPCFNPSHCRLRYH